MANEKKKTIKEEVKSKEKKLNMVDQFLKDYPEVKRWYNSTSRGSHGTASVYIRKMRPFIIWVQKSPSDLLKLPEKDIEDILEDYITHMETLNVAGSYIKGCIHAVRSYFSFNSKKLTKTFKVKNAHLTPKIENEEVPSQYRLKKILSCGNQRSLVSIILMAHSGLRPMVLGSGTDGLKIKDFPEMTITDGVVDFTATPTIVRVRGELSKNKHKYFSFVSEEGMELIKTYLEYRMKEGEELTPESPIITSFFKTRTRPHITAIKISKGVKEAMVRAGVNDRPYVLRAYFDTQLLMAESKGKITESYRQFVMGHVGNIEAKYTVGKAKIPKTLTEDMREAYGRCQKYLQTSQMGIDEDEWQIQSRKQWLQMWGSTPDEVDKMDLETMDDDDFFDMFKDKMTDIVIENGKKQELINKSQLKEYMDKGWLYHAKIDDNMIVVKLPDMKD